MSGEFLGRVQIGHSMEGSPGTLFNANYIFPEGAGPGVAMLFMVSGIPFNRELSEVLQNPAYPSAKRLVACWNALQGMPTEEVERLENKEFWPVDIDRNSRADLAKIIGIQNYTMDDLRAAVRQREAALQELQRKMKSLTDTKGI